MRYLGERKLLLAGFCLISVGLVPMPGTLTVPAKAVRSGPHQVMFSGSQTPTIYWSQSNPHASADSLNLRFTFDPTEGHEITNRMLFATGRDERESLVIRFGKPSRVTVLLPVTTPDNRLEIVSYSRNFAFNRLLNFDVVINLKSEKVRVLVNNHSLVSFDSISLQQNLSPGFVIDQLSFGQLGLYGEFSALAFSVGTTPFAIDSLVLRILLGFFGLLLFSHGLLRMKKSGHQMLQSMRKWIGGLQAAILTASLVVLALTGLQKQTSTSLNSLAEISSRRDSLRSSAVTELEFELDLDIKRFPSVPFDYIASFGKDQGHGFHLTMDHFGNIFFVCGMYTGKVSDFGLIFLEGPRIGPRSLALKARFDDNQVTRLVLLVDGSEIPTQSANEHILRLPELKMLPGNFIASRTDAFQELYGSISSAKLIVVTEHEIIGRRIFGYLLVCFLLACLVRRIRLWKSDNKGRPVTNLAEGHPYVFSENAKTKEQETE